MNIVVLGGAGYIGSFVVERLLAQGHQVTVADNLSRGNAWAVPEGGRFVPVDLLDPPSLERVLGGGCEAVVHCAGLALVRESVREPLRYFRVNLNGTLNLLDGMQRAGVRRLVYLSSAAVYGDTGGRRVAEDTPLRPLTPYATSTAGAEDLVRWQAAASSLGVVVLRVFNAAGAGGRLGEWHHPEAHLIPLALHTAAGLRSRITVHGVDHPTPDGTAVRDYVHVDDVARAALLALEATRDPGCAVYNIGTADGHSVREVLVAARAVTGRAIAEAVGPRHRGDPPTLVADPRAAYRDLGWAPTSTLVDILGTHWNWMRERLRTAKPDGGASPLAACSNTE